MPDQQIFAIYSRKSKFTGKGESIENQIEMCRQYISRFAIREIIMSPVYAKADEAMYQYLLANRVRPFSDQAACDGMRGIMAYNRTEQTKERTTRKKPMEEWVVAVGEHEGVISGEDWIAVQGLLDENRSKSYRWRAGQTNEALLSGLLHYRCRYCMRPKVTNRTTADGERHFRYLCELKGKRRRHNCDNKDLTGTTWTWRCALRSKSWPERPERRACWTASTNGLRSIRAFKRTFRSWSRFYRNRTCKYSPLRSCGIF